MLLNKGVSIEARVALWAFLILLSEVAHLRMIEVSIAFSVLSIVVIDTMFMVVRLSDVTRVDLEDIKVEMLND